MGIIRIRIEVSVKCGCCGINTLYIEADEDEKVVIAILEAGWGKTSCDLKDLGNEFVCPDCMITFKRVCKILGVRDSFSTEVSSFLEAVKKYGANYAK